jgi:hypothetical protein
MVPINLTFFCYPTLENTAFSPQPAHGHPCPDHKYIAYLKQLYGKTEGEVQAFSSVSSSSELGKLNEEVLVVPQIMGKIHGDHIQSICISMDSLNINK